MKFKVTSLRYDVHVVIEARDEDEAHMLACKRGGSAFEGKVKIEVLP
jgi:hypothetical protein